ncbi:hypothetical protein [Mycobacteroides chelonae]|uniref:hypothetical protein n=1 Tax=Mycobacteroides chelonae TaxID=1774 RepID=UPI000991A8C1|nr:hypothetical protein [Mycobacteroides chelonae]
MKPIDLAREVASFAPGATAAVGYRGAVVRLEERSAHVLRFGHAGWCWNGYRDGRPQADHQNRLAGTSEVLVADVREWISGGDEAPVAATWEEVAAA